MILSGKYLKCMSKVHVDKPDIQGCIVRSLGGSKVDLISVYCASDVWQNEVSCISKCASRYATRIIKSNCVISRALTVQRFFFSFFKSAVKSVIEKTKKNCAMVFGGEHSHNQAMPNADVGRFYFVYVQMILLLLVHYYCYSR